MLSLKNKGYVVRENIRENLGILFFNLVIEEKLKEQVQYFIENLFLIKIKMPITYQILNHSYNQVYACIADPTQEKKEFIDSLEWYF